MDKDKEDIEVLAKAWKVLPRNCEEDIKAADAYYTEYIMPISAKRFLANYGLRNKEYELMFVTVGTSWQPIALSALAKKPKRLVFISTLGTEKNIDEALNFMKKMGFLPCSYDIIIVDKSESRVMIEKVRNIWLEEQAKNVCIDITGGTKAMAAAGAMVAASLDMEIFYVESNYLPVYRHPEPCSERMVQLERPQDI